MVQYIGTAGGLLSWDGVTATLLTPLAVVGDEAPTILAALERALEEPNEEMRVRATLGQLESAIVHELRREQRERRARPGGT